MRSLPPPRITKKRRWRRFKRYVKNAFSQQYWRPSVDAKSNRARRVKRTASRFKTASILGKIASSMVPGRRVHVSLNM
ncbi:hypothetical protein EJF18_70080 [Clavispora lusitaniae]|uniref:Uncharacterized protein n=1 Tax=Clavispora lusitaniae TaxID=36911 RepID=A0ACD0WS48_CLALS|nr:hypothetical protein FOB63_003761 [Clavispora lusitaniae]QFZ30016.1 hypothetical protein EJF14_70080 [Clavispora lusitaniae]QFZ35680.1 hypothetical protein EJF16_70080 [Clavispora lusitaniae]QFZ41362.1 hypothetical protein EJF15_70080 [Clavispora lusitaniae]QFZ47040.1 hypothetical protein EJF18_70080 [Clavispora lusitaniae]